MEKNTREQFRDRMISAFKKKWTSLSSDKQDKVLDLLIEINGEDRLQNRIEIKGWLDEISNRNLSIATLILGLLLGVFGSLVAGILEHYVGVSLIYSTIILTVFFVLIFKLIKLMEEIANDIHQRNRSLESLLALLPVVSSEDSEVS